MTVQELYERIGGNYESAIRVMKIDKLIDRYVGRFLDSDLMERMRAAGGSMDANGLFEAAHAMKGVCGNLGLDKLAEAASELAEEFRPGSARQLSDDEVHQRLAALESIYGRTVDGIRAYKQG